jgi:hypothetical protein
MRSHLHPLQIHMDQTLGNFGGRRNYFENTLLVKKICFHFAKGSLTSNDHTWHSASARSLEGM